MQASKFPRFYAGLVYYGATRKVVRLHKSHLTYTSKVCIATLGGVSAIYLWPIYVGKDIYDLEVIYRKCPQDCGMCIFEKLLE